jgi:hypothetical protein
VLTKTGELFTREKDARHKAVTDLAWLTSAWGDGSPGTSLPSTCGMMVLCVPDVLQPYIDDLVWRREHGARRAAADIAIAVLLGLYECRDDTDEDTLLVRMGLPGAADDLAHTVYKRVKSLHLSLPSLADECPEWAWYEES